MARPKNLLVVSLPYCTVALALAAALLLGACGQRRAARPEPIDPEHAARLGLTQDATDPTQRDIDAGYYRWVPKPEPTGTEDPNSPNRRKIGGPNPSGVDG